MRVRGLFLAVIGAGLAGHVALASDFGTMGQTFPIAEQDLLTVIETKLRQLEANGRLAALNEEMRQKAEQRVRRPAPVEGLTPATSLRRWIYDPSIIIEEDIKDQQGRLIAARGQRVNPLELIPMRRKLAFVNGDRREEILWALKQGDMTQIKIIFVAGSPFDEMKGYQRRFYFDQGGFLTEKFGIRHTPAIVEPNGTTARVIEQPIGQGRGA